jgi:HAD superfamily hydrolase (TIGR01490 family)
VEAAFFDLDKTVIAKASMLAFGRPLYNEGLIPRRMVLRALWGQLIFLHLGANEARLARMRESVLALTRGWHQEAVRRIVAETLEEVVDPIIFGEALQLMEEHRRAGRRVFIVSASPEEIVVPLCDYLGADQAIASRSLVDDEGRYTGEMAYYAYGPYKAEALAEVARRQGLDLSASYAYSDSYTDVPMLEAVGHPVAVNPDRVLLKLARERGWEVRQFEHPVPLRARVAGQRRPAAAMGLAALGVGAAVLGWRLGGSERGRSLRRQLHGVRTRAEG